MRLTLVCLPAWRTLIKLVFHTYALVRVVAMAFVKNVGGGQKQSDKPVYVFPTFHSQPIKNHKNGNGIPFGATNACITT